MDTGVKKETGNYVRNESFAGKSQVTKLISADSPEIISFRRISLREIVPDYFPDIIIAFGDNGYVFSGLNVSSGMATLPYTGKNLNDIFGSEITGQLLSCAKGINPDQPAASIEYSIPENSTNKIFQGIITSSSDSRFLFMGKEITPAMHAEEALLQSEQRFRSVWENSIDGMRLLDINGSIIAANNSYSELVGLKPDEYLGRPFISVYKNTPGIHYEGKLTEFSKNFRERTIKNFFEMEAEFRSGKELIIEVSNIFIESSLEEALEGEVLLLSIFRNVTERHTAERDLRKAEKLAAIGRMSAYLSHEIKTPLASIKMNIEMIKKDPLIAEKNQKSLGIIEKEIKRLNRLLKDVLHFSKDHQLLMVKINLRNFISSIRDLVDLQLRDKKIQFVNNVNPISIMGDYQKLHSAMLHLIENAVEAIDSAGKIELFDHTDVKDGSITVFIKDSGYGIENVQNIFEPFYTTKNAGTGLGLAIAQKIVEQHNGKLQLYASFPGETIFGITFFNQSLAEQ